MSRPSTPADPRRFFFFGGTETARGDAAGLGTASVAAPGAYPSAPPKSYGDGEPLGATDLSLAYDRPGHPDDGLRCLLDGFGLIADAARELRDAARPCPDCGLYAGHRGGCTGAGLN